MTIKQKTLVSLSLISLGIALGPGYAVYKRYFSGKRVLTLNFTHPKNTLPVILTPEMNPLGCAIIARSKLFFPRSKYRVSCSFQGKTLWERRFNLSFPNMGYFGPEALFLKKFVIDEKGEYIIDLEQLEPRQTNTGVTFELQANVTPAKKLIWLTGLALIVLGLGIILRV